MTIFEIYLYIHEYWTLLSIPLFIFFEFSVYGETCNLNVKGRSSNADKTKEQDKRDHTMNKKVTENI